MSIAAIRMRHHPRAGVGRPAVIRYNPLARRPLYHARFTIPLRTARTTAVAVYTNVTRARGARRPGPASNARGVEAAPGAAADPATEGQGRRRSRPPTAED